MVRSDLTWKIGIMTTPEAAITRSTTAVSLPLLLTRLRQTYPGARCQLHYQTPIQLLVATILSSQCTNELVNQVTPLLFTRFPTAVDLATANRLELTSIIRPTGFSRQKARYIQEAARIIVKDYDGEVPNDMAALVRLPGVARRTANMVLGEIYQAAAGITVDTHVTRLTQRLGLSQATDPGKVEQTLMTFVPRELWIEVSRLLVFHSHRHCHARSPECLACPLNDVCPSAEVPLEG